MSVIRFVMFLEFVVMKCNSCVCSVLDRIALLGVDLWFCKYYLQYFIVFFASFFLRMYMPNISGITS